jgi:hypothetical protein
MKPFTVLTTILVLTSSLSVLTVAADEQESATVKGPEAADLAKSIRGYVVGWNEEGITSLELPECKQQVVVPLITSGKAAIHSIAGPDGAGTIVYVENRMFAHRHLLKSVKLDGAEETVIFDHQGSAFRNENEIGKFLALAPLGGKVAVLQRLKRVQMPRALLFTGELEIITLADKVHHATRIVALDEPMSWFPDGRRLAYSRLVARKELPKGTLGLENFGSYFENEWDELPAIYVFDTETTKDELLCVGWRPLIDNEGKTAFIGGWGKNGFQQLRLDLQMQALTEISSPGLTSAVVGAPTRDLLIYFGLPTAGTPIKMMKYFSPLRGPRPLQTIKIANIGNGKFQTIVPYADPRLQFSFGQTADQRDVNARPDQPK